MVAVRRLTTPPIAEAVIAFGVHHHAPLADENPGGKLPKDFMSTFPRCMRVQRGQFAFKLAGPEGSGEAQMEGSRQFDGFRFESADGSRIATYTNEQALFSLVNSYGRWDDFVAGARQSWDAFKAISKPALVHRIGLRYINKCKLPLPVDSTDYLTAGPRLPDELKLDISGFISQVQVDLPVDAKAMVVQLLEHGVEGSSVVVDVDVSRDGLSLDPDAPELWSRLESFRDWKNKLFFSHVTEKLLEPYK